MQSQKLLSRVVVVLLALGLIGAVVVSGDSDDDDVAARGGGAGRSAAGVDAGAATGTTPTGEALAPATTVASGARAASSSRRGGGATPSGGAAPGGGAVPGATASDRGVTASTIKVGITLVDAGNLSRVGVGVPGIDPEQQREAYSIYIDELNKRGGIHGRKVETVFEKFDVTSHDSMRAACLVVTRDAKSFAVLDSGGLWGPAVLCVTQEHQTPFVTTGGSGLPKDWYTLSQGRLITVFQGGVRAMRNFAWELDRLGKLRGRRVGIVADLRPGQKETVDELVDEIRDLGHNVAHRTDFSADLGVAAGQVPVEVAAMKSKDVDAVLLVANTIYAAQFVQEAGGQLWNPRWYTSDWQNGQTDVYAQSMTQSFDGSLNITIDRNSEYRTSTPEPALDKACRETYEKKSGKAAPRGSNEYQATVRICSLVELLGRAGTAAGVELTRDRFMAGLLDIGTIPLTQLWIGGSFARNKPDAADYVRTQQWQFACHCWMPFDDFRKTRY